MLILCLSYFITTLMVCLNFLFNQWDCTNIPWIANNSLTLFSKNIRFGTIHILRQLGGSEKFQNYADVIYEYMKILLAVTYVFYVISTNKLFLSSLFACGRADLLEIHISDVIGVFLNILEYFLIILLWVYFWLFNRCQL